MVERSKKRKTMKHRRWMINEGLAIVFICLFFAACSSQFNSAEDLQSYISKEKNGLIQSKEIGNMAIKVAHRPTDLLVNQELSNQDYTQEEVTKLREKYNQYAYFTLSLSAGGQEVEAYNVNGQGDFGSRVQQLAFGMSDKVELHTNARDTITVADYVYQRTFGIGNSSDMLFAFKREELKSSNWIQFQLDDFGLGIGTNRFRFKTKDIENAPKLKF